MGHKDAVRYLHIGGYVVLGVGILEGFYAVATGQLDLLGLSSGAALVAGIVCLLTP